MEWKTFGMKRKLISAKHKVFHLMRSIGILGKEDPNVSSLGTVSTVASSEPVEAFANRSLEVELFPIELKKAEALRYWRTFMDRPK